MIFFKFHEMNTGEKYPSEGQLNVATLLHGRAVPVDPVGEGDLLLLPDAVRRALGGRLRHAAVRLDVRPLRHDLFERVAQVLLLLHHRA